MVERVTAAFGGVSAFARALGHSSASTVGSWNSKKSIPSWRFSEIREAATRIGVTLPDDFPPAAEAA